MARSTSASAIRIRPRASWFPPPSFSRREISIRRSASRPCATPTTKPMPWRSPTSWCRRPPTTTRTYNAGLKKKIADFIFGYATADEAEKKVLAGLQWAPFKKSDNNQLLPIRQMEVNKALTKVKADTSIAEADKQAQVAELQKKFDELGKKI